MTRVPFAVMSLVLIGCGSSDPSGTITSPDAGTGGSSATGGTTSSGGTGSSTGGSATSTGGAPVVDAGTGDGADGAVLQQPRCDYVPPCATQVDACSHQIDTTQTVCKNGVTFDWYSCGMFGIQYFSDGAYLKMTMDSNGTQIPLASFTYYDSFLKQSVTLDCGGAGNTCDSYAVQFGQGTVTCPYADIGIPNYCTFSYVFDGTPSSLTCYNGTKLPRSCFDYTQQYCTYLSVPNP